MRSDLMRDSRGNFLMTIMHKTYSEVLVLPLWVFDKVLLPRFFCAGEEEEEEEGKATSRGYR